MAITELKNFLANGDKDAIHKKIEELNAISKPYAERLMDMAISKTMKGTKISE